MNYPINRPLRMALIGGSSGFIAPVHATAATLDRRAELVAGVFSSDPAKSVASAPEFGVSPQRAYGSVTELLARESNLPAEQRIDFVSIATPNFTHFEMARDALRAGFHVVCDKPMTLTTAEARELVATVEASGKVFALTHNYTGYPMVRQAREMVADGQFGEIEAVRATYIQGWMRGLSPDVQPTRGVWKADPAKSGSGALGDIGTHAYNLACFITQLSPADVCCKLKNYQPGRCLDDYGHAMIRFTNGALGMVTFSQVTHGRLNDLVIEVDGTQASLLWRQEAPNQLHVRSFGEATRVYERNPHAGYTLPVSKAASRLPAGHPEAFFEAFANIYRDSFDDMIKAAAGADVVSRDTLYPNVYDGLAGVDFIERCLASDRADAAWVTLNDLDPWQ